MSRASERLDLERGNRYSVDHVRASQIIGAGSVYAGKRLRLSGDLAVKDSPDAPAPARAAFYIYFLDASDNYTGGDTQPGITGTQSFSPQTIVLDVPNDTVSIYEGFVLSGSGEAWANDVRLDVVDHSVPVTTDAH